MQKIKIIVDYNAVLFNFVDGLSRWSPFVHEHVYNYFLREFELTPEDRSILDDYTKAREPFSWDGQRELFEWALEGLPEKEEYKQLLPAFRHFEGKKDRNGISIRDHLTRAVKELESIKQQAIKDLTILNPENEYRRYLKIFRNEEKEGEVPCYLTFTPDAVNRQGGANGGVIFTQVFTGEDTSRDQKVRILLKLICHEYAHIQVDPSRYFWSNVETKDFYRKSYPHIWSQTLTGFAEEAIIHCICDCFLFGMDPRKKRDFYHKRYEDEPDRQRHYTAMYQATYDVSLILGDFREGKKGADETLKELDAYFRKLVERG